MGTIYYAVNDEKKEAFVLGKNSFHTVLDNAETLSLEDRVALQYTDDEDDEDDIDKIAAALRKYEPFRVISEHDLCDLNKYRDYVVTGSRYDVDSAVGDFLMYPINRAYL